jgi:hypothetical protein
MIKFPCEFKSKKMIFIDFEYRESNERQMDLVCVSMLNLASGSRKSRWLHNDNSQKITLFNELVKFNELGYAFVAYNVVAEARCFISLGLDPVEFTWIDLMLEHRQLTNSRNKLAYGAQLIKGNVVKTVNRSKWDLTEEQLDKLNRSKCVCSLASAAYKFTGRLIDTEHKSKTIDMILSNEAFNPTEQKIIIKYCLSDVIILPDILRSMVKEYMIWFKNLPSLSRNHLADGCLDLGSAMLLRGRYAALTALMVSRGYPVKRDWFVNFLNAVPEIYKGVRTDIASQFEELPPFVRKYKKKNDDMRMSTKNIREWITTKSGFSKGWLKTDTGQLSLKSEAWQKFYNFKHDYPKGNYAAQIMRWNSFRQSMSGFAESEFKDSKILEYYGKDSRIRPYKNPYGTLTGRSAPSSRSFIPLKTAWSRSMIYLEDSSKFLCSIDYGSQEVLIQAIISGDRSLYESYVSGDVYLDFAKKAGAIPKEGTKKSHPEQRNLYKTAFLAIGYGVGFRTLANQIASNTGEKPDEEKAKELIEQFYEVYHVYKSYLDETKQIYGFDNIYEKPSGKGFLQLPCGWILFGDNLSHRSVGNFMIQGTGSTIMREAVYKCYQKKLPVVYTLHDALTCELSNSDEIVKFQSCMKDAFVEVMTHFEHQNKQAKSWANKIRLDTNCWGEYFKNSSLPDTSIKQQVIYIDERAESSFDFYSKYFMEK